MKSKKNNSLRKRRGTKVSRKLKKGGDYELDILLDNYEIVKPRIYKEIYYDFNQLKDGIDMILDYLTEGIVAGCQNYINPQNLQVFKDKLVMPESEKKDELKLKSILKTKVDITNSDIKGFLAKSFKSAINECNLVLNNYAYIKDGDNELQCTGETMYTLRKKQSFVPILELLQNAWDSNLLGCDTLEDLKKTYIKIIIDSNGKDFDGYPTIVIINKGKELPFSDNDFHTYEELKSNFRSKTDGGPKDTTKKIGDYSIFGGKTLGLSLIDNNKNYKLRFRKGDKGESMVYLARATPIGIGSDKKDS